MKLSEPQKVVASDPSRFRVLTTGRRFGKTTLAIRELCYHARIPNKVCWFVAPSYRQARQIAWMKLKKILAELRWVMRFNETELTVYLKNNSMICLRGADNPDSLRGVGIDFLVIDECADIDEQAWTTVLRPTLSDTRGKVLFAGTPKGHNWFYDLFQKGKSQEDGEWSSHLYTTEQGGWVDAQEIEQAKKDLSAKVFRQEYQATWETYTGVVFYAFDMVQSVKNYVLTDDDRIIHVGVDFNLDPISAVCSVIRGDTMFIFDEIQIYGSNTDELCEEIMTRYPGKKIVCYPDPSCVARRTSAGGRTDLSILQNNGFVCKVLKKHAPIRDRVNSVNSKFLNANNERKLFISPKCKNLLNTLTKQVYKEGTSVPDKSQNLDHLGDALGYMVNFLYPITRDISYNSTDTFNVKTRATYGRV